MSIKDDKEDFENSGVQGELRKLMREHDKGYVLILPGGWRGERRMIRPSIGEGPYVYFQKGEPLLRFENDGKSDDMGTVFKLL